MKPLYHALALSKLASDIKVCISFTFIYVVTNENKDTIMLSRLQQYTHIWVLCTCIWVKQYIPALIRMLTGETYLKTSSLDLSLGNLSSFDHLSIQ